MANPAPIPWDVSVVQLGPGGKPLPTYGIGKDFANWLQSSIVANVSQAPFLYTAVRLTAQHASIATTPIPLPQLAEGLYRVSYYARITTVDAVSSSLTVTIGWTDGSAQSLSGVAMTGNTTTTVQSASAMIEVSASPITYATVYASNTPNAMQYKLSILVEGL